MVFRMTFNQKLTAAYNNKLTDISNAFQQVYDQYANQNIGAIILSTDGIYTTGQNPIYTITRKPNIPIFTIGLGDTTIAKDLLISEIVNNDIAFLGNDFPVQATISQNGYLNETVKVTISDGRNILQNKIVEFKNGED